MWREKERVREKEAKNNRRALKIHQKTIANRSNRAGVIKQTNL